MYEIKICSEFNEFFIPIYSQINFFVFNTAPCIVISLQSRFFLFYTAPCIVISPQSRFFCFILIMSPQSRFFSVLYCPMHSHVTPVSFFLFYTVPMHNITPSRFFCFFILPTYSHQGLLFCFIQSQINPIAHDVFAHSKNFFLKILQKFFKNFFFQKFFYNFLEPLHCLLNWIYCPVCCMLAAVNNPIVKKTIGTAIHRIQLTADTYNSVNSHNQTNRQKDNLSKISCKWENFSMESIVLQKVHLFFTSHIYIGRQYLNKGIIVAVNFVIVEGMN